ncbi:MAG: hypothetical protein ACLPY5_12550 [Candidatus Bathyarchaeia archaeon]
MVLFKTAIVGVAVLIIGILLLTVIGPYVTVTAQNIQTRDVDPHVEFLVGDMIDRSYTLPSSVPVFGSVYVSQAPTNQTSNIQLSIFDADNYQIWSSGGQANSLYSTDGQGQFNYTFTTPKSGLYYFVFDNRASLYKKYVVFSLSYNEVITSQEPDTRIPYLAWAFIIVGGLVAAVGLIRKPAMSWA